MDARSTKTLSLLWPAFAALVEAADTELTVQGIRMCVYSGLRNSEEQDQLYASSRPPKNGPWRTNAKAGESMHNYGLAADIVAYLPESSELDWNPASPSNRAIVAALKAQGLEWGGDWLHAKDMDHFQMPGFPASPSMAMRADYGDGPAALARIWAKAAAGEYAT